MSKIRVFEAFAGIGAQSSALKKANIDYEVVGISEWFINALKVYDAIHTSDVEVELPSYEEQVKYLKQFTFSRDSVNPITNIEKLRKEEISELYKVNKRVKNYGSITEIKGENMPECDLLVYSFPCQDLSTGGKTLGMKKGSGTRSGLLWEIERILIELKKCNKLPKCLLMENVKTIFADSNRDDLNQWLKFLTSMGYKNGTNMVLNAVDFGIPQRRKRAFIISTLGENIDDRELAIKKLELPPVTEFLKTDYSNPIFKLEADAAQLNRTISRETMWKINGKENLDFEAVNTITCNMDRNNTSLMLKYNGPKGDTYRLLTIREAFLLMGFSEEEYEKACSVNLSYRQMNKLIGNSIVVNVLSEIFKVMFEGK